MKRLIFTMALLFFFGLSVVAKEPGLKTLPAQSKTDPNAQPKTQSPTKKTVLEVKVRQLERRLNKLEKRVDLLTRELKGMKTKESRETELDKKIKRTEDRAERAIEWARKRKMLKKY